MLVTSLIIILIILTLGHYVPAFSHRIMLENQNLKEGTLISRCFANLFDLLGNIPINYAGSAIGNGLMQF
jgi:hypothetical protein